MTNSTRPTIDVDPDGFNDVRQCISGPMIFNKYDQYVGASLNKYGEFSRGESDLFRQIVKPGSLVVEVGANIGAHTVDLSRLVGKQGSVFAFEPQRLVFQTLCANLAINQCTNVYAFQRAVGAKQGAILAPAVDPSVRTNFGGLSLINLKQGEPVSLVPLDALELPACHFLKVDVEGMEIDVLRGAKGTIEKFRPAMYLENDRADRSRELIQFVMDLNYDLYWHTPYLFNPDNFAADPENIFPGIVSVNMICKPSEQNIAVTGFRRIETPSDTWNQ